MKCVLCVICVFAVWLAWRDDKVPGTTETRLVSSSGGTTIKGVKDTSSNPDSSLRLPGQCGGGSGQAEFLRSLLAYITLSEEALGLPKDLVGLEFRDKLSAEVPGRQIPAVTLFSELGSAQLTDRAIPLPEANTLAHLNYQQRRFGRLQVSGGETVLFNPEMVLVKFHGATHVSVVRVEQMREWEAVEVLGRRSDVQFAGLDVFHQRQFSPDDPLITNQWQHAVIGSFAAWERGLGQSFVRIAIVDTPFQMDHPDLAPNTISGWDVVANGPVTSAPGIVHSTMCAGMAAAAIGNHAGVAGAVNCKILPININGAESEMYNAIIWAADHDVRVVSMSWSGGDSAVVEAAAYYLKQHARGILGMSGVNGTGFLNYTNQPDIYCISMTDAANNMVSRFGDHIDFAAPGWQIFSTSTGGAYNYGSGTSFATPLFCGVVAGLFSLNPTLSADEAIELVKSSAADLGQPGWDQFYGWGRINFDGATAAALETLPNISGITRTNNQIAVTARFRPSPTYSLWRSSTIFPTTWSQVTNAIIQTNGENIRLIDPLPSGNSAFYRVEAGQ